ncbi:invasion associated locus B family protein [Bartonella tamiae]|nr:invasion associated locus B family protein [Bartonella tamiae]
MYLLFSVVFCFLTSFGLAQPLANEPSSPVHAKQFDDWFYRCNDVSQVNDKPIQQCEVVQLQQVKQGDETVTVLSIAIALTAPQKAGQKPSLLMTSITPLNVYLPSGLRFSINGKDIFKMTYRNCNQAGCWAQQKLDNKALTALKKSNEATGHFRLINGQNVNIKFSLKGFSSALNAFEKGEVLP